MYLTVSFDFFQQFLLKKVHFNWKGNILGILLFFSLPWQLFSRCRDHKKKKKNPEKNSTQSVIKMRYETPFLQNPDYLSLVAQLIGQKY